MFNVKVKSTAKKTTLIMVKLLNALFTGISISGFATAVAVLPMILISQWAAVVSLPAALWFIIFSIVWDFDK
jgi:Sec-independent protein secretion pathway component TatC